MSNKRISELPRRESLEGGELIPFAANGANGVFDVKTLSEYIGDGGGGGSDDKGGKTALVIMGDVNLHRRKGDSKEVDWSELHYKGDSAAVTLTHIVDEYKKGRNVMFCLDSEHYYPVLSCNASRVVFGDIVGDNDVIFALDDEKISAVADAYIYNNEASQSDAGLMSAADKTKLDSIPSDIAGKSYVDGLKSDSDEKIENVFAEVIKKADKATTLSGYGITDGATKDEVQSLTENVASAISMLSQTMADELEKKADTSSLETKANEFASTIDAKIASKGEASDVEDNLILTAYGLPTSSNNGRMSVTFTASDGTTYKRAFNNYAKDNLSGATSATILLSCSGNPYTFERAGNIKQIRAIVTRGNSLIGAFRYLPALEELDLRGSDFSNVTTLQWLIYDSQKLKTLHLGYCDLNSLNTATNDSFLCKNSTLTTVTGVVVNLKANISFVWQSKLTRDSAMVFINGLYDYASEGDTATHTLKFSTATKNLLTADDIAIATAKGWTIA